MRTINYGIIGCGMMGQEHLRNIALLPETRVAAIYEPDAEQAQRSLAIAPDAEIVSSVAALLAIETLDCLLVAAPNHLHVDLFEEIARTRPLPLLIEKPLFTSSEQVDRLRQLEASYPAPVWVAMEYRYMPPIQKLIDEAKDATGGITMLTIREHRFPFLPKVGDWNRFNRNTGGTFVEKCCHFFDLMRLLMQSEPVRVMASAGQDVNHLDEVYNGETPDIWDAGFVIVEFENGTRAMLELCMYAEGSRYQEEITAVGPKGKIEAKVPGPGRFWPEHLGAAPVPQVIVSPRNPPGPVTIDVPVDATALAAGDHNGSTLYQHQKFVEVVRQSGVPEVTLECGRKAVEMGLAAQLSATTGQTVDLTSH
ncbi:Gfo/Idh/MocA family oxidoreductase [Mesobacterium sp. TK19101]|uniref:Gfo/Idh/MocA family oxidoreductase n=1 Tax=Mesobacterium hydrothermale TaxID=3111907 RepID=A0ABU6HLB6_9RHOB|nr:Gfo/Idh/MocA family oxidoreductase [Mesobacterium sp. TK19101]MEC3863152.1 Gfo/Idh/MocA family oxidoreductase [Mesobacterium sp. TK19101]